MKKKSFSAVDQGSTKRQPNWLNEFINPNGIAAAPIVAQATERVFDLRTEHPINPYSLDQWKKHEPTWLTDQLRTELRDMLRGLDRAMAREVIECLSTFINWGTRDFIGVWYIDRALHSAYNKLAFHAERQGVILPEQL